MSTQYEIADDGAGTSLQAFERSGKISIGLSVENTEENLWTSCVFTTEHLIKMCVDILTVASYIAEDSESVRAQLNKAIAEDRYLGSMEP